MYWRWHIIGCRLWIIGAKEDYYTKRNQYELCIYSVIWKKCYFWGGEEKGCCLHIVLYMFTFGNIFGFLFCKGIREIGHWSLCYLVRHVISGLLGYGCCHVMLMTHDFVTSLCKFLCLVWPHIVIIPNFVINNILYFICWGKKIIQECTIKSAIN